MVKVSDSESEKIRENNDKGIENGYSYQTVLFCL